VGCSANWKLSLLYRFSLLGMTPLVAWFSRVKEVCYTNTRGQRQCMGGSDAHLYNELNIMVPSRRRAFFVPGIYATSELIQVGRSQGMPKMATFMSLRLEHNWLESRAMDSHGDSGARRTLVLARLIGRGLVLGRLLSFAWPLRVWPAVFPSGKRVRALILRTPKAYLAYIQAGQISVNAQWLRKPVRLFPVGLYLPDLRMQLPGSGRSRTL
jgi:hypothetical protein